MFNVGLGGINNMVCLEDKYLGIPKILTTLLITTDVLIYIFELNKSIASHKHISIMHHFIK